MLKNVTPVVIIVNAVKQIVIDKCDIMRRKYLVGSTKYSTVTCIFCFRLSFIGKMISRVIGIAWAIMVTNMPIYAKAEEREEDN